MYEIRHSRFGHAELHVMPELGVSRVIFHHVHKGRVGVGLGKAASAAEGLAAERILLLPGLQFSQLFIVPPAKNVKN